MDDRDAEGRPGNRERLAALPWVTHIVVALGLFAWMVGGPVREYGLTSQDPYSMLLMDPVILGFAWLTSVPVAFVEAAVRPIRRRWIGRAAAGVATLVLAWFGTLPVGLRFYADQAPVTHAEVRSAAANVLVLLGGYLVLVVVLRRCFGRGRVRP